MGQLLRQSAANYRRTRYHVINLVMNLLNSIQHHAAQYPLSIALQSVSTENEEFAINYDELNKQIAQLSAQLFSFTANKPVAINIDNHPAWVLIDLAALACETVLVPLPSFFSNAQLLHSMQNAGVVAVITDNPNRFCEVLGDLIIGQCTFNVSNKILTQFMLAIPSVTLPDGTVKITYTSGTTGNPKGVCLGLEAILNVANSIKNVVGLTKKSQHACILPLSTLLENVAGVYATLLAGGTVHILPSAQVGFSGSEFDSQKLYETLANTHANTVILIPELLKALVLKLESGAQALSDLQFVAVGGAHVATHFLNRAKHLGIPVFEGYGLSECASVVALNTSAANKIGSVGKPLKHIELMFSQEQEILVKGANFLAYAQENLAQSAEWLATGDIGYVDDDGYLFINGRKKHIFITSFGRNVSPEWIERELTSQPAIAQACLFGEAKPWNTAVIVAQANANIDQIQQSIAKVNQTLPDYARTTQFVLADTPFSVSNQQLTPNSRLKRDAIWRGYEHTINAFYAEQDKDLKHGLL